MQSSVSFPVFCFVSVDSHQSTLLFGAVTRLERDHHFFHIIPNQEIWLSKVFIYFVLLIIGRSSRKPYIQEKVVEWRCVWALAPRLRPQNGQSILVRLNEYFHFYSKDATSNLRRPQLDPTEFAASLLLSSGWENLVEHIYIIGVPESRSMFPSKIVLEES
jgi:hypothetical protein